jgi:RNA polymerase sigma factor (sigma-70 family)
MIQVEQGLVEAACQGDHLALEKLLAISQPNLKRFARRVCVTSEDAEDAVQVALWKLHRQIKILRATAALTAWLFRIIERECFRLFRILRRTEPLTEFIEETLYQAPIPHVLRHDLAVALASLPAVYREVLILRDIDELTAPETAIQLNISVAAVKSRLHRARTMMRDALMAGNYWSANVDQ